ncbi:hypothetical protein WR25_00161 [Diploscapter pachys]|uniref:mitogen-activated protein kinase kinase n=1 Tax=Diploscapter pachys TaxID=2018661 RepID=A0A2A2JLG9_9BILA|nr:hypothetical protein WR25_00161 [Diploscapter pachys]
MERPTLNLPLNGIHLNQDDLMHETVLSTLSTGTLHFPDSNDVYTFTSNDLLDLGVIGSGNFGTVYKMQHRQSEKLMAVKRIRCNTVDKRDQQRLLREHNTIMLSEKGPNIVKFFGAIFHEGDCWICMELMDISLDPMYKRTYRVRKERFEENIVGHVAVCTVDALAYLKQHLQIIHRDVKPSNILCDRNGNVKLCDFGICGELEDSVVKTHDAGCQPYLAPERVTNMLGKYDVRSDVWSLGITLYEISMGVFPYAEWFSPFDQITAVVNGDAPMLQCKESPYFFTLPLVTFINSCLTKDYRHRPKYDVLKTLDFYKTYKQGGEQIALAQKRIGELAMDCLANPVEIKA